MDDKILVFDYLKKNKYMALATSDTNAKPEVATVEYVLDGDTLLVNTHTHYRKYKNLIDNPRVACVVTTEHEMTLQFDAEVQSLESDDAESAKQKMLEAEPDLADYFNQDTRFFKITPTWMRLRDYTGEQLKEIEYNNKKGLV